eukprot:TRINITY_DN21212_c0_g1_i1.p1 TRINITY_DN21212_c0_g1~~TRINITY_DN21212_c0_g1_i1.p1  ORF type:complete len:423 (-),score=39.31 TRINITY_DN21212_c0_g1_i1:79-1347(-)
MCIRDRVSTQSTGIFPPKMRTWIFCALALSVCGAHATTMGPRDIAPISNAYGIQVPWLTRLQSLFRDIADADTSSMDIISDVVENNVRLVQDVNPPGLANNITMTSLSVAEEFASFEATAEVVLEQLANLTGTLSDPSASNSSLVTAWNNSLQGFAILYNRADRADTQLGMGGLQERFSVVEDSLELPTLSLWYELDRINTTYTPLQLCGQKKELSLLTSFVNASRSAYLLLHEAAGGAGVLSERYGQVAEAFIYPLSGYWVARQRVSPAAARNVSRSVQLDIISSRALWKAGRSAPPADLSNAADPIPISPVQSLQFPVGCLQQCGDAQTGECEQFYDSAGVSCQYTQAGVCAPAPPPPPPPSSGTPAFEIVGIVSGVCVVVAAMAVASVFWYRRRSGPAQSVESGSMSQGLINNQLHSPA